MERTVLHCDLNNFFASVECVLHPEYGDRPVAVCGSVEERHGICLAKNYAAKRFGVQTGDTVGTVLQKCPNAIIAEPHYEEYEKFSHLTQQIYARYTDQIEPFGCDESWLDVSDCALLFGDGGTIADRLREEVKRELGLTISVGVSYNKIFAKLGSDMKKPDAVTCISRTDFKDRIWHLPASELLGVGPMTYRALQKRCVYTIGQLAATPPQYLRTWLGKNGDLLWRYANGLDDSAVVPHALASPIKSISRGLTPLRNIESPEECAAFLREMTQDVGRRLRKNRMRAGGVHISLRDIRLHVQDYQMLLPAPTDHTAQIEDAAVLLFLKKHHWSLPLRSASVGVFKLTEEDEPRQIDLAFDAAAEERRTCLDSTVDALRDRYGSHSICSASYLRMTKTKLLAERKWNPAFSLGEGQRDGVSREIPFGTLF